VFQDDPETPQAPLPEPDPDRSEVAEDAGGEDVGGEGVRSDDDAATLSVGRVARETGISAETLRIWERRYGRPVATRLPSGHRRYSRAQVVWLRRVAEAVARGVRASIAVRASEVELDELVRDDEPERDERWLQRAMARIADLDPDGLERVLLDGRDDLDVVTWLRLRVGVLVREVGSRWASGEIDIRHEHMATDRIAHVLRRESDRFTPQSTAPLLLLATLPGEQHGLGLLMAELVALQCSWRTAHLGPNTPAEDIAKTALDLGARAVGLSVSLSTRGIESHDRVIELRERLTDGVDVLLGGEGARSGRRLPRGVHVLASLRDASQWFAVRG